jgi:RNA polymerase sigma-70 factor (ECF subfamily)
VTKKSGSFDFLESRLSRISTPWSLVHRAHHGQPQEANPARQELFERYKGAIYRYLLKVVGDQDSADEVFQEFALNLVHGDLKGADPKRGRFRDFVKGTLFHLIADYRHRQQRWPRPLPAGGASLAASDDALENDRGFAESWADELLARAWAALSECETQTGQPFYTVLRLRADHPEWKSPEMAEKLDSALGRSFTPVGARQLLHRAREKFGDLLLAEVANTLDNATVDELEQELIELFLFEYCRPALQRLKAER